METDLMACRIFCHLIVKIKMLLELLIIWHRLKLAKLFLSFQCECGSKLCTHFKSSSQFRLFSTKHQKPENPLTDNLISGCERNVYAMRKVSLLTNTRHKHTQLPPLPLPPMNCQNCIIFCLLVFSWYSYDITAGLHTLLKWSVVNTGVLKFLQLFVIVDGDCVSQVPIECQKCIISND